MTSWDWVREFGGFANLNPPVDNNDNTPAIGVGGFTYVSVPSNGNFTLPIGGVYIVNGDGGFSTGGIRGTKIFRWN